MGFKNMKNAWIFPGQASQKIGMGKDLFENTKIGKKYYEIANDLLDTDIQSVSFNGPEELLKKTRTSDENRKSTPDRLRHVLSANNSI